MSKDSIKQIPKLQVIAEKVQLSFVTIFGSTLLFYIAQFLPAVILVLALSIVGKSQDTIESLFDSNLVLQLLAIVGTGAMIVYFVFSSLRYLKKEPIEFLTLKNIPSVFQFLEVIVTYGLYIIVFVVLSAILQETTSVDTNQAQELGIASASTTLGLVAIYIMLVVVPAISEEVLFRGFMYKWLKHINGRVLAAIFTSVLFGLAHLEYDNLNWIAVIDTLVFSGFLIWVYEKHQSLYSAMFLHAIKNSVAFFVLYIL